MLRLSRGSRHLSYKNQLRNAVENVSSLLEKNDRLSYLLAQYIPEPARNTFLAIYAFGLEVNKIAPKASGGASLGGISATDLKFKFWSDTINKAFTGSGNVGEPIAFLLRDGLNNGENFDISYLQQFLQTRKHFLLQSLFGTVNDICSYGEGTYSQLNYAAQALLLSPHIAPSVIHLLESSTQIQSKVCEVAAHIGQSTSITLMILGLKYYAATRNFITAPVDLMTKFELSQESLLRLSQGHLNKEQSQECKKKLKNVIFETAVTANDHLLSARSKLLEVKNEIDRVVSEHRDDLLLQKNRKKWRKSLPDVLFTPMMVAIPTLLYLQRLEKNDFDVFNKKLQHREWRLAYTSFRSYYLRMF